VSIKIPILLSYYALSNGRTILLFGQITYTRIRDLSFIEYGRRKTFRTLLKLYRTKAYANQSIAIHFTRGSVRAETNRHGAFYLQIPRQKVQGVLEKITLVSGADVRLIEGLYARTIHHIEGNTLIVSDIDDTLLHSFVHDRLLKFSTLAFTTVEKRKAVTDMQDILRKFTGRGAIPVYLSNSEQNLYPLIYRFLRHNGFPDGPLFLRQLRKLWDLVMNVKIPPKNTHKVNTLEELIKLFPEKQFVLMGDNTQQDLPIYLSAAEKFGSQIRYIIIRKVVEKKGDKVLIERARAILEKNGTVFYFADEFPKRLQARRPAPSKRVKGGAYTPRQKGRKE